MQIESQSWPSFPPSPRDWEKFRALIANLYIIENKKLPELKRLMASLHSFRATDRMYKRKFTEWGLHKYYRASQKQKIAALLQSYDALDTPLPKLTVHGHPVALGRVKRYYKYAKDRKLDAESILSVLDKYSTLSDNASSDAPSDPVEIDLGFGSAEASITEECESHSLTMSTQVPRPISEISHCRTSEVIAFYTKLYSEWCVDRHPTNSEPRSDPSDSLPLEAGSILWDRFNAGLNLLERSEPAAAFASLEEGCQLARLYITLKPRLIFQNFIEVLGSHRWEEFGDVRDRVLWFLMKMAATVLGVKHPVSAILQELRKEDTLKRTSEMILNIMLRSFEDKLGPADCEVLHLKRSLCVVLRRQHDFALGETIMKLAIAHSQSINGYCHHETRRCLRRLGHLYIDEERYEDAEQVCQDVIRRGQIVHGKDSPDHLTTYTIQNLGLIALRQGKYSTARLYFRQVLATALLQDREGDGFERVSELRRLMRKDFLSPDVARSAGGTPLITTNLVHDMFGQTSGSQELPAVQIVPACYNH